MTVWEGEGGEWDHKRVGGKGGCGEMTERRGWWYEGGRIEGEEKRTK
jgi:hypothetical protein